MPKEFNPHYLNIVNLLKEDKKTCDIVSVYNYNGMNYLLRGGNASTEIQDDVGIITDKQIEKLMSHGFETRKNSDFVNLKSIMTKEKQYVSTQTLGIETLEEQKDTQLLDEIEQSEQRQHRKIINEKEENTYDI